METFRELLRSKEYQHGNKDSLVNGEDQVARLKRDGHEVEINHRNAKGAIDIVTVDGTEHRVMRVVNNLDKSTWYEVWW